VVAASANHPKPIGQPEFGLPSITLWPGPVYLCILITYVGLHNGARGRQQSKQPHRASATDTYKVKRRPQQAIADVVVTTRWIYWSAAGTWRRSTARQALDKPSTSGVPNKQIEFYGVSHHYSGTLTLPQMVASRRNPSTREAMHQRKTSSD
jgi:hypothetical protein